MHPRARQREQSNGALHLTVALIGVTIYCGLLVWAAFNSLSFLPPHLAD